MSPDEVNWKENVPSPADPSLKSVVSEPLDEPGALLHPMRCVCVCADYF